MRSGAKDVDTPLAVGASFQMFRCWMFVLQPLLFSPLCAGCPRLSHTACVYRASPFCVNGVLELFHLEWREINFSASPLLLRVSACRPESSVHTAN